MSKSFINLFGYSLAVMALVVFAAPGAALAGDRPYAGDLGQAIAAMVIFLVLLLVLGKFAWRPIINQLRRREEDIAKRIEDADSSQRAADYMAQEYRDKLDNIDQEAEQMLALARSEAAAESDRIRAAARLEAKDIRKRAEEDIASAEKLARQKIRAETAGMAAEIASRLLRKNISPEDHSRFVSQATEEIGRTAGDES